MSGSTAVAPGEIARVPRPDRREMASDGMLVVFAAIPERRIGRLGLCNAASTSDIAVRCLPNDGICLQVITPDMRPEN